jgi:hypothetical protein
MRNGYGFNGRKVEAPAGEAKAAVVQRLGWDEMRQHLRRESTTVIRGVSPLGVDAVLRAGYHVTRSLHSGRCSPQSDALSNAVYRCSSGSGIYDPCWSDYSIANVMSCLLEPWSKSIVRIHTVPGAVLPASNYSGARDEPWGIELATGERCLALQGAHDSFNGLIVDYGCTRDNHALLRGLDRRTQTWRIRAVHYDGKTYVLDGWVPITKAWFGGDDPTTTQVRAAAIAIANKHGVHPTQHQFASDLRSPIEGGWAILTFSFPSAARVVILHQRGSTWVEASCSQVPPSLKFPFGCTEPP